MTETFPPPPPNILIFLFLTLSLVIKYQTFYCDILLNSKSLKDSIQSYLAD